MCSQNMASRCVILAVSKVQYEVLHDVVQWCNSSRPKTVNVEGNDANEDRLGKACEICGARNVPAVLSGPDRDTGGP